jgi:hypothetical protein
MPAIMQNDSRNYNNMNNTNNTTDQSAIVYQSHNFPPVSSSAHYISEGKDSYKITQDAIMFNGESLNYLGGEERNHPNFPKTDNNRRS